MADFAAFRPYVLPEVPGCPLVIVDDAIREACRQFSADTWVITYDVPSFNTVIGTQSYSLSAPVQHEVYTVKVVVMSGSTELSPAPESTAARFIPHSGDPSRFWFKSPKLWLDAVPDKVVSLLVEAVVRPTQAAISVDDQYLEFREAIAHYAKAKLMAMTGKPWFMPDMSNSNYIAYTQITSKQRVRVNAGRVAAPLRMVASFF